MYCNTISLMLVEMNNKEKEKQLKNRVSFPILWSILGKRNPGAQKSQLPYYRVSIVIGDNPQPCLILPFFIELHLHFIMWISMFTTEGSFKRNWFLCSFKSCSFQSFLFFGSWPFLDIENVSELNWIRIKHHNPNFSPLYHPW